MSVIRPRESAGEPLVQVAILRAATVTIALAWPLWQLVGILNGSSRGGFFDHWYLATTATLFICANVLLIIGCLVGTAGFLVWALRLTGFTLVIAIALLVFRPYSGDVTGLPGIWFIGFSGVPAVAFALTVSPVAGTTFYVVTVGSLSLVNVLMNGVDSFVAVMANVGFGLINTFPFIVLAAATLRVSRVVDVTDAEARKDFVRARRLRARTEEMTGFTALVHDYVLSGLASVARGVHVVNPLTATDFSEYQRMDNIPLSDFTESVRSAILRHTPHCVIEVRADTPWVSIASGAASNALLALAEVARNSAQYAPSEATRTCAVTVDGDGSIEIIYADDGPGFDPETIRPTAAGIRVSVKGRMASVNGGYATVASASGAGTVVRLGWLAERAEAEEATESGSTDISDQTSQPIHSLMGLNIIFAWQYACVVAVVFAFLMIAYGDPSAPASMATYLGLILLIFLLVPGAVERISLIRTTAIAIGIPVVAVLGMWQRPWGTEFGWISQWHLSSVALIAVFLALRGRPLAAGAGVLTAAVALEVVHRTGISLDQASNGVTMLTSSIIVVAAALVNLGSRYFLRRLPAAREQLRQAEAEASAAEIAVEQRRSNLLRLKHEVDPVFDAADAVESITEALKLRARLTELRLRDMLRSPLLDVPTLSDAVQDARARGVKVLLLDDLSHSTGDVTDSAKIGVDNALAEFLRVLDSADAGTVTIRLMPSGRNSFASVSDGEKVLRLSADGGRLS